MYQKMIFRKGRFFSFWQRSGILITGGITMNVEHNKQPAGSLKISQEVLATIANFASEEIDGVVSLANTYTPIKNFLKKGSIARPIQISLNDDVAVIDISVNLKYGANSPEVAETLQKTVKDAVQNMTGITVSKVDIVVQGIAQPADAAPQS